MEHTREAIIEAILATQVNDTRKLLAEVYDAALQAGYEKARKELTDDLLSVLSRTSPQTIEAKHPASSAPVPQPKKNNTTSLRAPRGSARPAVLAAMQNQERGMTVEMVSDAAKALGHDIKPNTARSTLNKLKTENLTEKRGSLWFLAAGAARQPSIFGDENMTVTPH